MSTDAERQHAANLRALADQAAERARMAASRAAETGAKLNTRLRRGDTARELREEDHWAREAVAETQADADAAEQLARRAEAALGVSPAKARGATPAAPAARPVPTKAAKARRQPKAVDPETAALHAHNDKLRRRNEAETARFGRMSTKALLAHLAAEQAQANGLTAEAAERGPGPSAEEIQASWSRARARLRGPQHGRI